MTNDINEDNTKTKKEQNEFLVFYIRKIVHTIIIIIILA